MTEQIASVPHDYSMPVVVSQTRELQIAAIASELGISKTEALAEIIAAFQEILRNDLYGRFNRAPGEPILCL